MAIELARSGFDVVVGARSVREGELTPYPGTIHETAKRVRQKGRRPLPVQLDLNSTDNIRNAVQRTIEEFGRIDVMVNNARWVGKGQFARFIETDWDVFEQTVNVNLRAVLLLHRIAPVLAKELREYNIAVINLDPGFTLIERYVHGAGSEGYNFDTSKTHSVWVPARAAAYLATCRNPLAFSGKTVKARELVLQLGLMTEDELTTPRQAKTST